MVIKLLMEVGYFVLKSMAGRRKSSHSSLRCCRLVSFVGPWNFHPSTRWAQQNFFFHSQLSWDSCAWVCWKSRCFSRQVICLVSMSLEWQHGDCDNRPCLSFWGSDSSGKPNRRSLSGEIRSYIARLWVSTLRRDSNLLWVDSRCQLCWWFWSAGEIEWMEHEMSKQFMLKHRQNSPLADVSAKLDRFSHRQRRSNSSCSRWASSTSFASLASCVPLQTLEILTANLGFPETIHSVSAKSEKIRNQNEFSAFLSRPVSAFHFRV